MYGPRVSAAAGATADAATADAATADGRFVVAVDGVPRALADPHGRSVAGIAGG